MDTYEKKYKESLALMVDCIPDEDGYVHVRLQDIFPELRESEDERIRKRLIEFFQDWHKNRSHCWGISVPEILAWLEKQSVQEFAEKVESKFKVKYAGNEYNVLDVKENMGITWYGIEDEPNHIDYVKANSCEIINVYGIKENGSPYPTKPAIFAGYKPTDETMKEALRTEYEKGRADAFAQMQKEWSEEDEVMIANIRDDLFCYQTKVRDEDHQLAEDIEKEINWLKSLKERYTWKPSDEQMEALNQAKTDACGKPYFNALASLYVNLQ